MKNCPYCAEEIQDDAIKCRHCNEFLNKESRGKWYFKTSILVIAILSVGPFALPLILFNPAFSLKKKIILSIVVIIVSWYLGVRALAAIKTLKAQYQVLLEF